MEKSGDILAIGPGGEGAKVDITRCLRGRNVVDPAVDTEGAWGGAYANVASVGLVRVGAEDFLEAHGGEADSTTEDGDDLVSEKLEESVLERERRIGERKSKRTGGKEMTKRIAIGITQPAGKLRTGEFGNQEPR